MRTVPRIKKSMPVVGLLLGYVLAVWMCAAPIAGRASSLAHNKRWFTPELRLTLPTFHAASYFFGPQALARDRLNLHAWGGFQEVLFRTRCHPGTIEFDFLLGTNSYVCFLFDRDMERVQGVRLSANPEFPSIYFRGTTDGEFTAQRALGSIAAADRWHHARMQFARGILQIEIDGKRIGEIPVMTHGAKWVGFRGSATLSAVENFDIVDFEYGTRHGDTFESTYVTPAALAKFGVTAAFLCGVALLGLRWATGQWRSAASWLLSLQLCAASAGFTFDWFQRNRQFDFYPRAGALAQAESRLLSTTETRVMERITERHTLDKASGTIRVLMLGTSQTFGAGAEQEDDAFVIQMEAQLRMEIPGLRLEAINGGVPGSESTHLLDMYRGAYLYYDPDIVVVNLSCNDHDPELFEKNLEALIAINRDCGVETLFMLEAMSLEENPEWNPSHMAMWRVAQRESIPTLDALHAFAGFECSGFLWWDVIHPTSYGHRILGGMAARFVRPHIEAIAARR